jgi:hypothetical protein
VTTIKCMIDSCARAGESAGRAVETHWRIEHGETFVWAVCRAHILRSKSWDDAAVDNAIRHGFSLCLLYLPIVQPVVGSEAAIAVECFMDAVCRLLRWEPADVEKLRVAQQQAYEARDRRAA